MTQLSHLAAQVVRRLRPPTARSARLVFGFSREGRTNPGHTLELTVGEPVTAAAVGTVAAIHFKRTTCQTGQVDLIQHNTYQVELDHGQGLTTVVGGLATVSVVLGQTVTRGQALGMPLTREVFFQAFFGGSALDPASLNRFFLTYDERFVPGKSLYFRPGPDGVARPNLLEVDFYDGSVFYQPPQSTDYRVHVDFGGTGAKSGPGLLGSADDQWNLYALMGFVAQVDYGCGGTEGLVFDTSPVFTLDSFSGEELPLRIERLIEPAIGQTGSTVQFDPMLSTWIGGFDGMTPVETLFALRHLPAGPVSIILYAHDESEFTVEVDGVPTVQSVTGGAATNFEDGVNYRRFDLVLPYRAYVTVSAQGYLSGMTLSHGT